MPYYNNTICGIIINFVLSMIKLVIISLVFALSFSLKMGPPTTLNESNFQLYLNTTFDEFMVNGSIDDSPWFLFFKIPNCEHCKQAQMLFTSFYIEYRKKMHFQHQTIGNVLQTNFRFGMIDCEDSPQICLKFNIRQYPTYYVVQGNGEVCNYVGDRMPYNMIAYLEQRKRGGNSDKCKSIGKITFLTRILDYFEPIRELITYNTALFFIAFIVGPFLFGYIFSRNKARKETLIEQIKKQ